MSIQFDSSRKRWVVRWYEARRQRSRRFADEPAAQGFDEQQRKAMAALRRAEDAKLAGELALLRARVEMIEQQPPEEARRSGVSAYATRQGDCRGHGAGAGANSSTRRPTRRASSSRMLRTPSRSASAGSSSSQSS